YDGSIITAEEVSLAPFDRKRIRQFLRSRLNPQLKKQEPGFIELLSQQTELSSFLQNPFYLHLTVLFLNRTGTPTKDFEALLGHSSTNSLFKLIVSRLADNTSDRVTVDAHQRNYFTRCLGRLAVTGFPTVPHLSGNSIIALMH